MLSVDATALLDRARAAEHAVDLYLAPGGSRVTADRLSEILRSPALTALGERPLWNLLFAAGELSLRVDVYRAHELFRATIAAVSRLAATTDTVTDPRAAALEMSLHFFFARPTHPLLPLRAREVMKALTELLASGARPARRAAIHGLGHLLTPAGRRSLHEEAQLVLDEYLAGKLGTPPDDELARYAREARSGALR